MLLKAFGIYPKEAKNVFRFVRLGVLFSFGASMALTLSAGFFIEKVGPSYLPIVHIIIALVLIATFSLFIYLLRTITPYTLFFKLIYISIFLYLIFSIMLIGNPSKFSYFIIYTFSYILILALAASYWNFLDQYHDLQDAKRVYGIYNGAYFGGYIISGIIINQFFHIVGVGPLFILSVLSMVLTIFEIRGINKKIPDIEDDILEGLFSAGKRGFLSTMRLFYKSPFSISLVITSLIVQFLRNTTEFNYMHNLKEIFESRGALVTPFLGKCSAIIYSINVILGVFFYRRLVIKLRVVNVLIIPSLLFLFLYSNWIFYGSLFIVVLAIFSVDGILDTIDDNNFNLLANVTPTKIRGTLRIINDSIFEPVGMLLSAFFLLVFQSFGLIFGLALSLVFLIISLILRYLYPRATLKNLKVNAVHFERKFIDWMQQLSKKERGEIEEDILEALDSDLEDIKILAFEILLSSKDGRFLQTMLSYAEKFSPPYKLKAVDLMERSSFSKDKNVINIIKKWHNSNDPNIQKSAKLYLSKKGLLKRADATLLLKSQDPFLRKVGIIGLKKVKKMETLQKDLDLFLSSEDDNMIIMGLEILEEDTLSYKRIFNFLSNSSIKVRKRAAKAFSKISNKKLKNFAPLLIDMLKKEQDSEFRTHCLESLCKIKDIDSIKELIKVATFFRPHEKRFAEKCIYLMGKRAVATLISMLKDEKLPDRSRIMASKILGRLNLKKLQINITSIIKNETKKAYFYFFHSHSIQSRYPLYDLNLLKKALKTGFQSKRDFIIHLVGVSKSIENCDLIVHLINSKHEKAHANAVETLEYRCDSKTFKEILLLIEDIPDQYKMQKIEKKYKERLTLLEVLSKLEDSPSLFDKTVSMHFKAKFKMPKWRESLTKQLKTEEEALCHFANELLSI